MDEWNLGPNNQETFQELKWIKPASIGRTQGFWQPKGFPRTKPIEKFRELGKNQELDLAEGAESGGLYLRDRRRVASDRARGFGEARGMNAGAGEEGGWICGGFCGALRGCGAGAADAVRRGGGGGGSGGVMWGWLVRMTKGMARGWQWPSPEATRCLSLHPPGARACGCGVHCCDVCSSNSAIARAPAACLFPFLSPQGGRRRLSCCLVSLLPGGSKQARRERERKRACACLFGMVLCRAHSKKRKRQNANRCIEKNLAICNPDSVARSSAFPVSF